MWVNSLNFPVYNEELSSSTNCMPSIEDKRQIEILLNENIKLHRKIIKLEQENNNLKLQLMNNGLGGGNENWMDFEKAN